MCDKEGGGGGGGGGAGHGRRSIIHVWWRSTRM